MLPHKVATSRFDVGGRHSNSTGLDAFIYGERDIYRPGETMHAAVISTGQTMATHSGCSGENEVPVTQWKRTDYGSQNTECTRRCRSCCATFLLLLLPVVIAWKCIRGNDVLLGSKNLMVEEFLPDRIKVAAKLDKPFLLPGQTATLNINATNFFGPPAANETTKQKFR